MLEERPELASIVEPRLHRGEGVQLIQAADGQRVLIGGELAGDLSHRSALLLRIKVVDVGGPQGVSLVSPGGGEGMEDH